MAGGRFSLLHCAGLIGGATVIVVAFCAIRGGGPVKVEGDTPQERIDCINRLAEDRPDGAADAIAAAATDTDDHAYVRQAAVMALDKMGDVRHRSTFEACTRDVAPWTREAAAKALRRFTDDDSIRRLGELLAGDPTGGVRTAAARSLARIATPPATAMLVQAIEKNRHRPVRFQALASLEALLERHGPDGESPWEAARWNRLKAEVDRVRPLARTEPVAATQRGSEHYHERGPGKTKDQGGR
jgi:hypothetical protein